MPTLAPWTILALVLALPGGEASIDSPIGTGEAGYSGDGGPAAEARLNGPFDVAYDSAGHLYFSDTFNHAIRRVDAGTGIITTVAGTGEAGDTGDGGPATEATLNEPYGLAIDEDGTIYFADRLNYRVRRIDGRTGVITTVAGNGSPTYSGDGGPGPEAGLVEPNGVALDGQGGLLVADVAGHRVRLYDIASGRISTFAGTGEARHGGDGGPATDAALSGPRAVHVGRDGTVYILERNGNTLRAVSREEGIIRTIAGTGAQGYSGDGGPATDCTFDGPKELDIGAEGNIYIVDTENQVIRRIDGDTGIVTTVAGDGTRAGGGDGGVATETQLDRPHGVAVAPDGFTLVIGDTNNHRIRRVTRQP